MQQISAIAMRAARFPQAPAGDGRKTVALLAMLLLVLLSGCAVGPRTQEGMVSYDFGLPPAGKAAKPRLQRDLLVAQVSAPAWLDNSNIYYRLAYQNAAQPQAYALSRWVMSPAALLGQRVRANIARASDAGVFAPADGVRSEYTLRLDLEEFSQVFDSAEHSHAALRLRASLIRSPRVVTQSMFDLQYPAATPDAAGGVRALIAASDDVSDKLIDWLAANLRH